MMLRKFGVIDFLYGRGFAIREPLKMFAAAKEVISEKGRKKIKMGNPIKLFYFLNHAINIQGSRPFLYFH
jgi:hypothetical protein